MPVFWRVSSYRTAGCDVRIRACLFAIERSSAFVAKKGPTARNHASDITSGAYSATEISNLLMSEARTDSMLRTLAAGFSCGVTPKKSDRACPASRSERLVFRTGRIDPSENISSWYNPAGSRRACGGGEGTGSTGAGFRFLPRGVAIRKKGPWRYLPPGPIV